MSNKYEVHGVFIQRFIDGNIKLLLNYMVLSHETFEQLNQKMSGESFCFIVQTESLCKACTLTGNIPNKTNNNDQSHGSKKRCSFFR